MYGDRLDTLPAGWVDVAVEYNGEPAAWEHGIIASMWRNSSDPMLDTFVTIAPGDVYDWFAKTKLPVKRMVHRGQETTRDAAMSAAQEWVTSQN